MRIVCESAGQCQKLAELQSGLFVEALPVALLVAFAAFGLYKAHSMNRSVGM